HGLWAGCHRVLKTLDWHTERGSLPTSQHVAKRVWSSMSEPHAPEPDGEPKAGHRGRTLAWTSSTYFGEGLPWSILHQIAAEYLTAIGMRPAQVGYTAWLHGTTMLKFLWSPIVDLFGSLRQWMIAMQALMGIGVGVLALLAHRLAIAGHKDVTWVWLL